MKINIIVIVYIYSWSNTEIKSLNKGLFGIPQLLYPKSFTQIFDPHSLFLLHKSPMALSYEHPLKKKKK